MDFKTKWFDELNLLELYEILKARAEIFVVEQKIAYQDLDDIDFDALHCFLWQDGKVKAYLRAFKTDENILKLGRVLTLTHGEGTGRALMEKAITAARENFDFKKIVISAQKYAIGFYEKFGFKVTSEVYLEDSIEHVRMELNF